MVTIVTVTHITTDIPLLQIGGYLVQKKKSEWPKVSIRREKMERIKRYLNSNIWKAAKYDNIANPTQFVNNAVEIELKLIEDVEWKDMAAETKWHYEDIKDDLKRNYNITSYKEYLNFLIVQQEG